MNGAMLIGGTIGSALIPLLLLYFAYRNDRRQNFSAGTALRVIALVLSAGNVVFSFQFGLIETLPALGGFYFVAAGAINELNYQRAQLMAVTA